MDTSVKENVKSKNKNKQTNPSTKQTKNLGYYEKTLSKNLK